MKANRKSFEQDEAVANVVGAILVVGIVFSLLLTVRLHFIPIWDHNAESEAMKEVELRMGRFHELAAAQVGNDTLRVPTVSLGLYDGRTGMFSSPRASDALVFQDNTNTVRMYADRLFLLNRNGTSLAGVSDSWTAVATTGPLTSVVSLDALRIRIATVSKDYVGGSVVVSLLDSDGDFAGSYTFTVLQDQPDLLVVSTTRSAAGVVVSQLNYAFHQQNTISNYWLDALAPDTLLGAVAAAAQGPFQVLLSQSVLSAEYAVQYTQTSGGGSIVVGQRGVEQTPFLRTYSSGRLAYEGRNSEFEPQSFVYENGALILEQLEGKVMRIKPAMTFTSVGGLAQINVAIPSLSGDNATFASGGTVSLYQSRMSRDEFSGTGPQVTFTVSTRYPALWSTFWQEELQRIGLSSTTSPPQFSVAEGVQNATLVVYGRNADPTSSVNDVALQVQQTSVFLRLEA